MTSDDNGLRKIHWTQALPAVRLFNTFHLAVNYTRLTLALLCVLALYVCGRVLDAAWLAGGGGAAVVAQHAGAAHSEVHAYAAGLGGDFDRWLAVAAEQRRDAEQRAAHLDKKVTDDEINEAPEKVAAWLEKGLAEIEDNAEGTAEQRKRDGAELRRQARLLQFVLAEKDPQAFGLNGSANAAVEALAPSGDEVREFQEVVDLMQARRAADQVAPRGPFMATLAFQMDCFAGAVRGVASGRLGFSSRAHAAEPALGGSLTSAVSGMTWLATQRPLFALVYGLLHVAICGLFGGALTRHVAVYLARDEAIGLSASLGFAQEKFAEFVLAPLIPVGVMAAAGGLLVVGGLLGSLPVLDVLSGALFGLALLGGFVIALVLIGFVLGGHLMYPTIAVESSDAFDGITRAFGYLGQRPWHTAFYSLALLAYGGICFVMVRLIAVLVLKLSHMFVGVGFNAFFDDKLDNIWSMPAWHELSLLPTVGGTPFWGEFFTGLAGGTTGLAGWLIACWVFLAVAIVGAFVVSFFYCGAAAMYYLLRHNVDATDFDEVYYEESEEELLAAVAAGGPDGGQGLPIVEPNGDAAPPTDAEQRE